MREEPLPAWRRAEILDRAAELLATAFAAANDTRYGLHAGIYAGSLATTTGR